MNGRVARELRKTQEPKIKQYSKPFMAMLPEGELGEDGHRQLIPVHIPRKLRRLMVRKLIKDAKKGRSDAGRRNEER